MKKNYIQNLNLEDWEDYVKVFEALSNPIRIKILGTLLDNRLNVSELARILNISRPLLYLHLKKLEAARFIKGHAEVSDTGKAMKYYTVSDFSFDITSELITKLSKTIEVEQRANNNKE